MIEPRPHLIDIFRSPPETESHLPYLRLDKNERIVPFPQAIIDRFHELLTPEAIMAYPELEKLYQSLSAYLSVDREHLFLASGSDLAIKTVFETYISPGDKLLMHLPSYAMYDIYSKLFQAQVTFHAYDENLNLDVDRFIDAITYDTRMVVLENPNGFIGTVLPDDAIRAIVSKAHRTNTLVNIDEVYYLFTGKTVRNLYEEFDNVVVTRSFSKDFGIAGLRCGYLLSQPQNIRNLYRVKPMYEVTSATVAFCLATLEFPQYLAQYVDEIRSGISYLGNALANMGIRTGGGNGNFIVIYLGPQFDIPALIADLKSHGILVRRPFQVPSVKGWLRVGAGTKAQMQRFIDAFSGYLKQTDWAASATV
jgi:histidinol-phosphate aminotransferase